MTRMSREGGEWEGGKLKGFSGFPSLTSHPHPPTPLRATSLLGLKRALARLSNHLQPTRFVAPFLRQLLNDLSIKSRRLQLRQRRIVGARRNLGRAGHDPRILAIRVGNDGALVVGRQIKNVILGEIAVYKSGFPFHRFGSILSECRKDEE